MRHTMRHMMRHTIGVILCLAVLGTGFAVPAAATFAGTNGRLVFSRQGRVFTMDPDGTNRVLLTSTGNDYSPVWSPDGQRIAFIRGADAGAIWVMKADGTGAIRVSAYGRGWVQPPIWSPDGRSITYWDAVDTATGMVGAIFRVTPDGSSRTRLTTYGNVNAVRGWSPDGSRLIFESDRDGDPDIWVMNADGSGLTKLTQNTVTDTGPRFSPDGSRIVFYRAPRSGRSTAIWIMNADGTGARQLTFTKGFDFSPTFSPNGTWIAFRRDTFSARTGTLIQLYRMAPDGSGLRPLTGPEVLAFDFTWSPDSTKLLFVDGNTAVDMVNVDGTGFTTVLDAPAGVGLPDWQALA